MDFTQAPEEGTPSVLSIVVDQCVADFAPNYRAISDDAWEVTCDGTSQGVIADVELAADIAAWVKGLSGDNPIGEKIVSLVRGNSGWQIVIARRVMKSLKQWSGA